MAEAHEITSEPALDEVLPGRAEAYGAAARRLPGRGRKQTRVARATAGVSVRVPPPPVCDTVGLMCGRLGRRFSWGLGVQILVLSSQRMAPTSLPDVAIQLVGVARGRLRRQLMRRLAGRERSPLPSVAPRRHLEIIPPAAVRVPWVCVRHHDNTRPVF